MRVNAKKAQNILSGEIVHGQGSWGKVTIDMTGAFEVKDVHIDVSLLGKKEELENGVKDAIADSVKKVQFVLFKKRKDLEGLQN